MNLKRSSDKGYIIPSEVNMVCIKTFVVLLLLQFPLFKTTVAQDTPENYRTTDATTYQLYMQKDWDSLINQGVMAVKNGEDYFYLRLRMGIAYYYKGNYRKASQHLEKAMFFNANDDTTLEYLYHSYLYSKRNLEARELTTKFSKSLNQKLNTSKAKIFNQIYIETGPTFSNNIEKNKKGNLIGNDSIYGEQDLNDDKYYFQLGVGLNPLKRVSMYLGYSYLSISKSKQIQTGELYKSGNALIPWNGGYVWGNVYKKKADMYQSDYKLIQNQAYLNASISTGKGFIITPAFHFLYIRFNTIQASEETTEYPRFQGDPIPELRTTYSLVKKDTSYYNYVVSLAINKNICLFNFGLFGTYSNLNNLTQYQAGASVTFYPKGNLDLYSVTSAVSAWEEDDNRFAFEELIGVKVMRKLWMEGNVSFGEMINYNEKNAYVVYNSGDKTKLRVGINMIVPLSDKIEISVRYQYFNNEGSWFRLNENYDAQIFNSEYQNHTIIGGVTWKL